MNYFDTLAKAVLSSGSDAIIAADKNGAIRFWNPGAERIFGYTGEEAGGASLDIIIPERLRQRHWQGYDRVLTGGESRYGHGDILAVPAVRKDGTLISVEFTIVPLCNDAADLVGLVAIMRDVTKRFEETRALKKRLHELTKSAK